MEGGSWKISVGSHWIKLAIVVGAFVKYLQFCGPLGNWPEEVFVALRYWFLHSAD